MVKNINSVSLGVNPNKFDMNFVGFTFIRFTIMCSGEVYTFEIRGDEDENKVYRYFARQNSKMYKLK